MTDLELNRLKDLAFRLAKANFKSDRYYDWTVNGAGQDCVRE